MSKRWAEWKRNGTAEAIKALGFGIVAIGIIVFGVWAVGGFELFDTLKGF